MEQITTTDLYEAGYYLVNSCELTAIEGMPVNGKVACRLSFTGDNIESLQLKYFQGAAVVNLFNFRRAFSQISSYVHSTVKKFKNKLRQQKEQEKAGLEQLNRQEPAEQHHNLQQPQSPGTHTGGEV